MSRRQNEPEDLSGRLFGRLTALSLYATSPTRWTCSCSCGAITVAYAGNLKRGKTKSCGCGQHIGHRRTHGLVGSPEYKTWQGIKRRCLNPNESGYAYYSRVGICDRWRDSFEAFLADMGKKPSSRHSIDRIDNERGYEPGNCRWATSKQQARNRRCVKLSESAASDIRASIAQGERQSDVAKRHGISPRLVKFIIDGEAWS